MKTREEIADSLCATNLQPCIGKAHYLGAEYDNTMTSRGVWPKLVTLEDEGSIATDNWHTMEYIRADLICPTCRDVSKPPKEGFWPAPHFECSECGCKHVSPDYVRYCPHCGARVVRGDE